MCHCDIIIAIQTKGDMQMQTVNYVPVPGFPKYQVGDDGNVRHQILGSVWIACRLFKNKDGYMVVNMQSDDKSIKQERINRLVLRCFVGEPLSGQCACHNNGLRFDNRLENLRWDTYSNNELDKVKHGTSITGERNHQHRLTAGDVIKIKQMIKEGVPLTDIGHAFNVSRTAIYLIRQGHNWAHLK